MAAKKVAQPVVLVTWGLRTPFISLLAILVACLVVAAVYLTGNNGWLLEGLNASTSASSSTSIGSSSDDKCNLFVGKWIYDNVSYPLYSERQCSFMSDQAACEKFGRKDLDYQHWRWQPDHCDLPRFNATALLERLRGKRLVYVGDSLNRGQWVSMVCLVESVIQQPNLKSLHYTHNSSLIKFKAKEYNATIEFYWSPLLVESNSDDPLMHRLPDRIVRIQEIEKHARYWTDADILVFNTYLWWKRTYMKMIWGSFEDVEHGIYKEVPMLRSYEMALKTWSDWVEIHVNHTKTKMFFVSMSPTHQTADEWGKRREENCYSERWPIMKEEYWGRGSNKNMMGIVGDALAKLRDRGVDVKLINITQLSEYRKEAHPSIYRKQWDALTEEQLRNPTTYSDCNHWCLPGLPDVWNELLYAHIFGFS
ncbi:hypothetical protein Scep_015595 [Stephania cephalantha]|uniref:Trichome birefringence-like N-terminal domain-containing protein n=1 Tax=Stephania cephalantha TaxID=152367 RepID=A0AAP0J3G1_9MAGN